MSEIWGSFVPLRPLTSPQLVCLVVCLFFATWVVFSFEVVFWVDAACVLFTRVSIFFVLFILKEDHWVKPPWRVLF